MPTGPNKVLSWFEAVLRRTALFTWQKPWLTVGFAVLLTAPALLVSRSLELDTDLASLLPSSFPSVQALDLLEERFGGTGYLAVVARDAPLDALIRFAEDTAQSLAVLPEVRFVNHRRDATFLRDKLFYYLDEKSLEDLAAQLQEREDWERRQRNPLYLDLEDSAPPPVDLTGIGPDAHQLGGFQQFLRRQQDVSEDELTYYLDAERQMVVVLVKPNFLATDIARGRVLLDKIQQWRNNLDLTRYGSNLRVELTGRYTKRVEEQQAVAQDLRRATVLAFALIVFFLWVHFRQGLAILLVLVPLCIGLVWTFAAATIIFGQVNLLSAFVGAILLGLGIDHGIHLLGRFQHEIYYGNEPRRAIATTFARTGRAVCVAALTTTVAFVGLGVSSFQGFHQFGIVCACGTALMAAAYILITPPFLALALRAGWRPAPAVARPDSKFIRWISRRGSKIFPWGIALAAGLLVGLPFARFDYNLGSLQGQNLPSYALDQEVTRVLGHGQTPIVVLAPDAAAEAHFLHTLRRQTQRLGKHSSIDFVVGRSDLVPERQTHKRPLIRRIGRHLQRINPAWLNEQEAAWLDPLKRASQSEPFELQDIPMSIRWQFESIHDDDGSGLALVFPAIEEEDSREIIALAHEIRRAAWGTQQPVLAAGEAMVLTDILQLIRDQAVPILALIAILVFALIWILVGSVRIGVLSLIPALLAVLLTTALLPLAHIKINYLNIVVFPVLFGIGVDGGVHLITRLSSGTSLANVLDETGRAIAGAICTTALGFGALLVTQQPGLRSVGAFAVLGLGVNILACLILLPAFLVWSAQRRARHGEPLEASSCAADNEL